MPSNKERAETIHKLTVGTFETELGKRLLEHMTNIYVDRPKYLTGMSLDEVAFREGQADVIRKIIQEINRHG